MTALQFIDDEARPGSIFAICYDPQLSAPTVGDYVYAQMSDGRGSQAEIIDHADPDMIISVGGAKYLAQRISAEEAGNPISAPGFHVEYWTIVDTVAG